MHLAGGMAAVLIAVAVVNNRARSRARSGLPRGEPPRLFIGSFIRRVTFSGRIAFGSSPALGKKFRLFSSAPVTFKGQHC